MEIRYTIKVKDKHNPPEFKKGMGKGVVATQICSYKEDIEKMSSDYRFLSGIMEYSKVKRLNNLVI